MFPDADDLPTPAGQLKIGAPITFHVPIKLLPPPVTVITGGSPMIGTAVPEAAIHHHNQPCSTEEDVRATSSCAKQRNVNPVTQAAVMELPSQRQLRCGVPDTLALEPRTDRLRPWRRHPRLRHCAILPDRCGANYGYAGSG